MPSHYTLDHDSEAFIQRQLASGRYGNASDVVREALSMLEERERRLQALDASISRGLADLEAGRLHDADAVFDELDAELAALPQSSI